ncbi:MAG: acyltransferase [Candidatus Magasanikbacteria bacterium]
MSLFGFQNNTSVEGQVNNSRIALVDALKGFAIILVVVGHALQINLLDFDNNIFFRIIYSFHMPLFMFLSGFVAFNILKLPSFTFVRKKFLCLVVPFLAWYFLDYFIKGAYHFTGFWAYWMKLFFSPDFGLWFLWVLFLNFCCLLVAIKLEKKIGIVSYFLLILLIELSPYRFLGIGLLKWHSIYFFIGYLSRVFANFFKKYLFHLSLVSLVLFPILVSLWHRTNHYFFLEKIFGFVNFNQSFYIPQLLAFAFIILTAFSGIGFSYFIINILKKNIIFNFLKWLSSYSLDIYVLHFYFLLRLGSNMFLILFSVVTSLFCSIVISRFFLRKVSILDIIFLGGRKKIIS